MMQVETTNVDRMRSLGEDWIGAITDGALDRLEEYCLAEVSSQILTPRRSLRFETAADLAAKFRDWFGACSDFQVERSRVELAGERLGIFYRFQLLENGARFTVEQQLYCDVLDGRVASLQLLCSGFQPVDRPGQAGAVDTAAPTGAHALLEITTSAANSGSTCALLTPAIKARLREMEPGQVLEVRVDDPSARGDIEAWCRLSGNALVMMREDPGPRLRFWVKKK